jgi:hypothetical protein
VRRVLLRLGPHSVAMAHYIVDFHLLADRLGQVVLNAPVIPLRILANGPAAALETFARRAESEILETLSTEDGRQLNARVLVDERVFHVQVRELSE